MSTITVTELGQAIECLDNALRVATGNGTLEEAFRRERKTIVSPLITRLSCADLPVGHPDADEPLQPGPASCAGRVWRPPVGVGLEWGLVAGQAGQATGAPVLGQSA